jgi:enterochelin esterase-like enzyme
MVQGRIVGRPSRLFVLAIAGSLVAAGVFGWLALRSQGRVQRHPQSTALEATIVDIEAGRRTTPLIGEPTARRDATVTFLARRIGGHVPRIVSDVTGWGEHADGTFDFTAGTMTRVGDTDWYSLEANVVPRARIEYLIAYGETDYRLDPHNPRQADGPQLGGLPASEFVMPGYLPPQEFTSPPVPAAGQTTEATIESRVLRRSCRLIVYTPSGYRHDGNYPVAVFLDARSGQVARVLDWLTAHRAIEPIVVVFVDPASPGSHDPAGGPMDTFLTGEVLPWVASRYGITRSAGRRAVIGISFGAKDALDAALAPTGAFDNVGLLIPGRRIGPADIESIAKRRNRRLRVAILAGQYDRANVATARGVRQALADAGHAVDYTEVPEGHSAVTWTNHLRVVLVSLFGPGSASRRSTSGVASPAGRLPSAARRREGGARSFSIVRAGPAGKLYLLQRQSRPALT